MMKHFALIRSTLCIATIAASLCATSARAQELVTNGDFESSTTTTDFTGWTLSDPSFPFAQNIGMNPTFSNHGNNHANLAGDPGPDSMSQILNTTPGVTYTFTFSLAHDVTPTLGNSFVASWDGAPVFSQSGFGIQPYTQYTFDIIATAAQSTISFLYQDKDDFFRLDDVSVTAAVPEPSTICLGVFGIGLLAVAIRRRAAASA